jgi:hypothetical protein
MGDRVSDFVLDTLIAFFMPLVTMYHGVTECRFLNTTRENGTRIEQAADLLLAPFQYAFCGETASPLPDGSWRFERRFTYGDHFWESSCAAWTLMPPATLLGAGLKGLAFLSEETRSAYASMQAPQPLRPHTAWYKELGIAPGGIGSETLIPQGYRRRPGDERHLEPEKRALQEVGALLDRAGIPWWVDCGTCLGAMRYGGVIPWDFDIDVAVLLPDFDNVRSALSSLDRKRYLLQDWSSREHPKSYFKLFIREANRHIDIYHFRVDPARKMLNYLLSLENHTFLPESWRERERRFVVDQPIERVFPLKRGTLDGVPVFVPGKTEEYLSQFYGPNLAPAKIYNPETLRYEKDESHPYWRTAYVH